MNNLHPIVRRPRIPLDLRPRLIGHQTTSEILSSFSSDLRLPPTDPGPPSTDLCPTPSSLLSSPPFTDHASQITHPSDLRFQGNRHAVIREGGCPLPSDLSATPSSLLPAPSSLLSSPPLTDHASRITHPSDFRFPGNRHAVIREGGCPLPSDLCPAPSSLLPAPSSLLSYLACGASLGCPPDQLRNFLKGRVVLQPRQLAASAAARLCDHPDGPTAIGYGGARGGGKSFWLLAQMGLDDCQRYPGLKCLLLRKIGKSNLENFEDLRRRLFLGLSHEFSPSRGILTFANGSRIIAGHFQHEKDIDAYLGLEYDVIGVEEATTLTAPKYHDIVTCGRTSKLGWRPRIYSTTNPGGIGHAWYRTDFIIPFQQRAQTNTRFIDARVQDNAFTNAEYRRVLSRLTGWKKRAWLEGDWDIAAGQFFTNFRREAHVVDHFDNHRGVEWFAALDYGFTHYTVVLLGCTDSDGNIFVVDEYADRLKVPEQHAAAIQMMLKRHKVSIEGRYSTVLKRFVAGGDVFGRQSNGLTIAQEYARHGIRLRPANTHRVNGWAEILRRFGDHAAGIPSTLFIHRRCSRLLDCLPSLQHDPANPEDVLKMDLDEDGIGGDDAADAFRYLVATKPAEIHVCKLRGL